LITQELISRVYEEIKTDKEIIFVDEINSTFSLHNMRVLTHHLKNENEIKDFLRVSLEWMERRKK
jgi:hypothetical protein